MPEIGLHGHSVAPQQPTTNEPANGGQLALELDALWAQTRNPKVTLFGMTALYRRMAELRAAAQLENTPNGNS